jgi:ribosomal protein S18 acetylase RimI-like enzyme
MIMTNFIFKPLHETSIEQVHQAFVDAFSDYEVPLPMPFEKFVEMIKIRDLNLKYSLGCFVEKRLVGFIICGFRETENQKICYDGGTGVVKEFRRQGIGEQLLEKLIEMLKEMHINQFVLEVLENNQPAINLYEKYGFRKIRRLECFEIEKQQLKPVPDRGFEITVSNPATAQNNEEKYRLYKPTWQNEIQSVLNVSEKYTHVTLSCSDRVLGYGIIHKTKGDIPQIGILEEWKQWGLESHLVAELARHTENEKIIVLNVEGNNYLGETLWKLGFRNFVNQWEMTLEMV